jgi:hypothetical protein
MILPLVPSFLKKRWVNKLSDLGLGLLKIIDDDGREYDKESGKVGNLLAPNIIVAEETEGSESRKFALFESYAQVHRYCASIRTRGKFPHLYEVCPYFTKLHFDIDIREKDVEEMSFKDLEESKDTLILLPFLQSIESVFANLFPLNYQPETFIDNILVFEAHRLGDKISFHIVIDGFHLPCHESFLFTKEVIDTMNDRGMTFASKFADLSVYKKNQNFRMFGSNKATMNGSTGLKQYYKGPDVELAPGRIFSGKRMIESSFGKEAYQPSLVSLRILERSLISHTMGTVRLTLHKNNASEKNRIFATEKVSGFQSQAITIEDETLNLIVDMFYQTPLSKTEGGEKAFVFDKILPGDIICMKRVGESFCNICKRTHSGDNSWLAKDSTGNVFFICRRAQDSKNPGGCRTYIGYCGH